jgi:hypothetical protein
VSLVSLLVDAGLDVACCVIGAMFGASYMLVRAAVLSLPSVCVCLSCPFLSSVCRPCCLLSAVVCLDACHALFGVECPFSWSGPGSLRKVTFSVGLESPSDASDQVAFVSAPAFLAKERFESPDDLGDSQRF